MGRELIVIGGISHGMACYVMHSSTLSLSYRGSVQPGPCEGGDKACDEGEFKFDVYREFEFVYLRGGEAVISSVWALSEWTAVRATQEVNKALGIKTKHGGFLR